MAALAACMLLPAACGMHENGPAEQLVSGVVMPSGAEPYAPGAELTVTGEGFAPDDRILFEIHWTGGSGSFAPEGYAKGVFGTVIALTEHSVSFLAPAHYPASTVSVILFRGGDMQTLGRIRVADGVHEPGLYALVLSGAGTMQPVRIDPATGDAAPFGSPVAVGLLHSVVSASGSGILSGLDGDGRLVAIDLVTHRPTPEEGGWLALGTVNPGEVFRFGRGKEPGQLVMSGSGSRMWNLPESLSVEMLEPYPVVRASSTLLLSALRLPDGMRAPLELSLTGGLQVGPAVGADALIPFRGVGRRSDDAEGYELFGGYALSAGGTTFLRRFDPVEGSLGETLAELPGTALSLTELAAADGMPATVWLLCGDGDRRTIHGFDPLGGDVYTFAAPEGCSALVGVQ